MKGDVSVNNLSFTYPDGSNALNNLSIQIRNKEKVAILGANGAGKTTFVMHLNGVNRIQKGTVIIGGEDLNDDNINSIRKEVGIVFQDPDNQLFMPTVYEDVTFGPKNFGFDDKEIEKNAKMALDLVGMYDHKDKAPYHLSLGQKRKVSIATVLASKPKVIVFDEPSSNLDPSSRRELIEIIKSLNCTIILVTHDIPLALELCPRTVVIDEGKILCDMGITEFLANEKLMKKSRIELPFGFELHHRFHHLEEGAKETMHKHSS